MAQVVLKFVLFCATFTLTIGLERDDLYTFGLEVGDHMLVLGDESKDVIEFPSPFAFYDQLYHQAYVDTNGLISLNGAFQASKEIEIFPMESPPLIAPFWCDANTRFGGSVLYRIINETNDHLLERARQEVMAYFIDHQDFVPAYILIVTWDEIGYIWNSTLTNTFQAILMNDGKEESFVCFLYPNEGINWPPLNQPALALAGFNFGNRIRALTIPHTEMTHEILDIEETSNVHSVGKWLYHVNPYRINSPPYNQITATRILLSPPDTEVEEGALVPFMCTVIGWPIPFVTFSNWEESLMNNTNFTFKIVPEDSFTISLLMNLTYAKIEDTGHYYCLAEAGEVGYDRRSFFFGVFDVPFITKINVSNSFISGTDQNLVCVARGYPRPNIYWTSDSLSFNTGYGSPDFSLAPHTENVPDGYTFVISTLRLHPVIPEDHGTYTCIATNSEGETNATVEITVLSSPDMVTEPSDTELNSGDTEDFQCRADGRPLPTIIWKKNGVILSNTTNIYITEEAMGDYMLISTLTLVNATLDDIGVYECTASNDIGDISGVFNLTVFAPVTIISSSPQIYYASVNSSIVLECMAHGNPRPDGIEWRTANALYTITQFSNMTNEVSLGAFTVVSHLTIHFITLESRGNYTCVAFNEIEMTQKSDEETVVVFVLATPVITSIDSNRNTSYGKSITLTCIVEGYPLPDTVWLKENKEIRGGLSSQIINNDITVTTQLHLQQVTIDYAGIYTCHANNSIGTAFAEVDVIISAPPNITYISPQATVTQYTTPVVVFQCVAKGYPLPRITWMFGDYQFVDTTVGNEIGKEVVSELVIVDITLFRRGIYTCHAQNPEGTDSATVELIVHARPYVSTTEMEIAVEVGSNVTLNCSAIAFPEPDIAWRMDASMHLFGRDRLATMQSSSIQSFSFLTLDSVSFEDNGIYICFANNSVGSGEVSVALTVLAPPVIVFISPVSFDFETENIVLRCEVVGHPLPSITWTSDTLANHNLDHQSVTYERDAEYLAVSELMLENITLSFRGNYTCVANNSLGEADDFTTVGVYAAPTIDVLPAEVIVDIYDNVTMECVASGFPKPKIVWLRNGETFNDTIIIHFVVSDIKVSSTLFWGHIRSTETGVYTCNAVNSAGGVAADVELTVLEPPRIIQITPEVTASVNDRIEFQCVAIGSPRPSITWMFNGAYVPSEVVTGSNNLVDAPVDQLVYSILVLPNIQLDNMGFYICIVNNTSGEDKANTSVVVKTVPEILTTVTEINTTAGSTININCTVSGYPPPMVFWQIYGENAVNITDERFVFVTGVLFSTLTITGTILEDFGEYTCVAFNEEGETQHNFVINVLAPPTLYMEGATCITYGFPLPHIFWFNGSTDNVISNSSSVVILENMLGMFTVRSSILVTGSFPGNEGVLYHCGAMNSEGNISLLEDVASCPDVEPSISVWFEELSYTTEESSTAVSVCVETSTAPRSFHVQIQPTPGTASAGEDFSSQIAAIGFGLGKDSKQCTYIIILQDYAVESVEYFTATLQTPYENVQLLTAAANITIYPDHDRTTLQFEYPSYSMLEGEMTSICIVSEADIQRPVAVNVIPSSGGDLELMILHSITGQKYCFTVSAIADEEVEPKESVTLHIYSNDSSVIYSVLSSTTVIIGGDGPDTTLQYKYGFPLVDPLYIVAYFEAGYDLTLETCKLLVEGGQLREQNCSYGYVVFYFEDYAEQRPHTLLIEGRVEGQPEPFILSTVFRLTTITTCWVYLINDGITIYGSSIVIEWQGTGALNYLPNLFNFECKLDYQDKQLCVSPFIFSDVPKGQHVIKIRHIDNTYLCLDTPWHTYYVNT